MTYDNSILTKLDCDLGFYLASRYRRTDHRLPLAKGNAFHYAMEQIDLRNATLGEYGMLVAEGCSKYNVMQFMPIILNAVIQARALKLPPPVIRPDGTPMVEVKYCERYEYLGRTFNIAGTIDRISINGGKLHILDYKTTSNPKHESLGEKYAASSQLRFYRWFLKKWGHNYLPSEAYELLCTNNYFLSYLIVPLIPGHYPSFSTPYGHLEFDIARSEAAIHAQFAQAIRIDESPTEPAPTGMFHDACGNCDFNILCVQNSQSEYNNALARLEPIEYNPLAFRD